MSEALPRAERLLLLLEKLRGRRYAVSGALLARELGVSLRTLYRDIAALQARGAPIEGGAGVGYLLKPGFVLPPLSFDGDEIEALSLGARWVARRGDKALAEAARRALAKIGAVLPPGGREALETDALIVPSDPSPSVDDEVLRLLRLAIRGGTKVEISYLAESGDETRRVVWPFGLAFFSELLILLAWCELRADFRHFRVDRIGSCRELGETYPRDRLRLLRDWEARQGLAPGRYSV